MEATSLRLTCNTIMIQEFDIFTYLLCPNDNCFSTCRMYYTSKSSFYLSIKSRSGTIPCLRMSEMSMTDCNVRTWNNHSLSVHTSLLRPYITRVDQQGFFLWCPFESVKDGTPVGEEPKLVLILLEIKVDSLSHLGKFHLIASNSHLLT